MASPAPSKPVTTSASPASVTPSPANAREQNSETLRVTVQRQTETIETLHSAAAKYRSRLAALEQQLTTKTAEIESQRILSTENASLRSELHQLREKLREVELNNSRLAEASTLEAENQAQLGVKVQAYQRHNTFLQGEVALRESKNKALQEQIDVLAEEVHTKDRRINILVEKLRQHNIDPTTSVAKISVPEASYTEMKERLSTQTATINLLREKLESCQEDAVRREGVVDAQGKENKALKASISRLVQQINGSGKTTQTQAQMESSAADSRKLQAYHARRVQEYTAASPTAESPK